MKQDQDLVDADEYLIDTDRKRRMLTRDDRKYLTGKKVKEGDKKYMTEKRIRERVTGGIRDLCFLIETGNEELLDTITDYPPHVQSTIVDDFLESSLHYHTNHVFDQSSYVDDPLTPVDVITPLENRLEYVLPNVLTDVPFLSLDSVKVEINVEGTLHKKELLEEEILDKQTISENKYHAWENMGGNIDHLKTRLREENKELIIYHPEPDVDNTTITPDDD